MPSSQSQPSVSLADISRHYLTSLQRLTDLAVINWAGARVVTEAAYEETFRSLTGLPATPARLSFEAARTESAFWEFRNSFSEMMGLTQSFLEDLRKLCAVILFNAAKISNKNNEDLGLLAAEINRAEIVARRLDIPERFAQIKTRYQLQLPLEAEILSLVSFFTWLTHKSGTPQPSAPEGPLTLRLKVLEAVSAAAPQASEAGVTVQAASHTNPNVQLRFADYQKTWTPGEALSFSRQEHAAIFTTLSLFITSSLQAIQEFAKASGLPDSPKNEAQPEADEVDDQATD